MTRGVSISGWGMALPSERVTNADLAKTLDTTDNWIFERTGIRERRVGGHTADMATEAGRAALDRAGRLPSEVGLLVLATTTPDRIVPATSSAVHRDLKLTCGALDLNAACAGFVYALVVAHSMVTAGTDCALVVGSDALSRITDWNDRSTAVLFGDGAGAVVLEATDGEGCLLSCDLGVDGNAEYLIYCDHGGYLQMEGQEVYRRAVRVMVSSAERALEQAKVRPEDVALFVPHQANARIIEAAAHRLSIPIDRTALVLESTGNTSSASVPLALACAADDGRLEPDSLVLLCGFGAGMTWASAVVRWDRQVAQ